MRNAMTVTAITMLAATMACGGAPASGPSEVAIAAPAVTVAKPVPAWITPELRGTLLLLEGDRPKRWEGGPFRHCFNVDEEALPFAQAAAQRMTDLSGIQPTTEGPCNVEWITDGTPGHTYSELTGTAVSVVKARVFIHVRGPRMGPDILHEAGHVLGLGHSPRSGDLMAATPSAEDFSADERAVLDWMYGR